MDGNGWYPPSGSKWQFTLGTLGETTTMLDGALFSDRPFSSLFRPALGPQLHQEMRVMRH